MSKFKVSNAIIRTVVRFKKKMRFKCRTGEVFTEQTWVWGKKKMSPSVASHAGCKTRKSQLNMGAS